MGFEDQYRKDTDDSYAKMNELADMMAKKIKNFESTLNNVRNNIKEEDRAEFDKELIDQAGEMKSVVDNSIRWTKKASDRHERSN